MNPSARDNLLTSLWLGCQQAQESLPVCRRLPTGNCDGRFRTGITCLAGARHWAAVPSPHKTPLSTARVSRQHGRRSSLCRAGCRIASKTGVMHLGDRFGLSLALTFI